MREANAILPAMQSSSVLGDYFLKFGKDLHVDGNQSLLRAGDVARHIYLIKAGAARLCVCNAKGVETSVQFFFEGDMVCSLESMVSGCPSGLDLVTIGACDLRVIDRDSVLSAITLLKKCGYLPQQGAVFIVQEPWPVQDEPQPDWGQLAAQEDAPSAPSAHGPVQFSWHPVCPHD